MEENNKNLPDEISANEVFDVLEFARKAYNMFPGIFNPDLVNARMKDMNMNPLSSTEDEINTALANPKNSEYRLRGISEFFEYTNMLYKRTLGYLGNMLSFDLSWTCINAQKGDYKTKAYEKDMRILSDFLDKFDYKSEFKKAVRQMVRQDSYFTSFRDDGDRYCLQELPIDRCKITGKSEYGFLFDFDMIYFISNPGVDINTYHPVFKKYYNRVTDSKNNGYYPGRELDSRTGEWVYWVQTSPNDGMWAFKFNQEQAGQVPFLAPMFPDLVQMPLIRSLQKNKYIIESSRLLIGLVPLLKDNKSGNVKDMLALDPTTLGHFAALIRQGLPEAIKFGVAPLEDVKEYDFKGQGTDKNIYEEFNKSTTATSGINSRLLYSMDKQTAEETRNSISVDSYLMTYLYSMFEQFMNYNINKKTKRFKFKFNFEGTEFDSDKQARFEKAMSLADKGFLLPHKISNALGMNIIDLDRQLTEANEMDWADKLIPIISAYQQSSKNGRPTAEESGKPLSDSGQASRDNGSNIDKGGKI